MGMRSDDAVEAAGDEEEAVIRDRWPQVSMAALLARFDPARHRRELVFDVDPVGNETR